MRKLFSKFWRDEAGGEALESALLIGLIVIACIAMISTVGVKVVAQWQSLANSL